MSTNEGSGGRGKRRRTKKERGLPSDVAAGELAKAYLDEQNSLWPEAVRVGLIPPSTPDNIANLAQQFQSRFVAHEPPVKVSLPPVPDAALAASYVRFSDDSSNPRSLAQQLRLQLIRARENKHWVAWQHVHADAGVTGKDATRIGYTRAKATIGNPELGIQTLYIDEVGRASRDAIEALMLGEFIAEHEKRLIGISDGFDSNSEHSKLMLQLYAMVQSWFSDQLGVKVVRGMNYAFDMGASTGLPAVGYRLVPLLDASGNQIRGKDGVVTKTLAIDETMRKYVLLAFLLFTERHVSPERIAKYFNRRRVGGSTSWDGSRIRLLLKRHIYVGIRVRNMRRYVRKRDGRVHTKYLPREKWKAKRMQHLQIVSWSLWKRTQKRIEELGAAWRGKRGENAPARTDLYPTTLVRPICGCCKHPLQLGRSGKYGAFVCPNGLHGKHGCTFGEYKSVSMIEKAVLNHVLQNVLNERLFGQLVTSANRHISRFAKLPKVDLNPLRAELRDVESRLNNMYDFIQTRGKKSLGENRIDELEQRRQELLEELRSLEDRNAPSPAPLSAAEVVGFLPRIREVLQRDVAVAAPLLQKITGPVEVYPTGRRHGRQKVWEARFTVNLLPVLAEIGGQKDCPMKGAWEYLSTRNWTMPIEAVVSVVDVPRYELLAPEIKRLADGGATIDVIAAQLGINAQLAGNSLRFARNGNRPNWKPKKKGSRPRESSVCKYLDIKEEVARLHDQQCVPLEEVARMLGVSFVTALRAHRAARPDLVARAAAGESFPSAAPRLVKEAQVRRKIADLLVTDLTKREIAEQAGCSLRTVFWVQRELKQNDVAYPDDEL